jgi:hypothetical protein
VLHSCGCRGAGCWLAASHRPSSSRQSSLPTPSVRPPPCAHVTGGTTAPSVSIRTALLHLTLLGTAHVRPGAAALDTDSSFILESSELEPHLMMKVPTQRSCMYMFRWPRPILPLAHGAPVLSVLVPCLSCAVEFVRRAGLLPRLWRPRRRTRHTRPRAPPFRLCRALGIREYRHHACQRQGCLACVLALARQSTDLFASSEHLCISSVVSCPTFMCMCIDMSVRCMVMSVIGSRHVRSHLFEHLRQAHFYRAARGADPPPCTNTTLHVSPWLRLRLRGE